MASSVLEATECSALAENMRALRARQPELARRLAVVTIPVTAVSTTARDDMPTFTISTDDGCTHWLGRSSMPSVRAAALVADYGADSGNVLLPRMGGGMEVAQLLARLAMHSAVFVLEPDLLEIRLALSVHDFSDDIRAGRLIILATTDPARAMTRFFAASPGYDFPQKLLWLPFLTAQEIKALTEAVERTSGDVARVQAKRTADCRDALARRISFGTELRSVVVSTIDPRPAATEAVDALARAARDTGLLAEASIPNRPDKCHSVARMRAIVDADAGAAIFVNCGWGPLLRHAPPSFPTATWLLPEARLIPQMTDGFSEKHLVFAATGPLRSAAIAAGADPARIELLPPGFDATVFAQLDPQPTDRFDVACFGDVADLKPESQGITLSSQVSLWKRLCIEAACRLNAPALEIMESAEKASGVVMGDEPVRKRMLSAIEHTVMPTLVLRASVQALLDAGIDVRVFGAGWQFSRVPDSRVFASPRTPQERNRVYNASRTVICPLVNHESTQRCVEVALSGGVVVRGSRKRDGHEQLGDALDAIETFDTVDSMRELVVTHLRGGDALIDSCGRVRDAVLDRHLLSHRFAVIRRALARMICTS